MCFATVLGPTAALEQSQEFFYEPGRWEVNKNPLQSCEKRRVREEGELPGRWDFIVNEHWKNSLWNTKYQLLVSGFNPSEKYESIGMMKFPIYGKRKRCSKPTTRVKYPCHSCKIPHVKYHISYIQTYLKHSSGYISLYQLWDEVILTVSHTQRLLIRKPGLPWPAVHPK